MTKGGEVEGSNDVEPQLIDLVRKMVGDPRFDGYYAQLQAAVHGPSHPRGSCYWCFLIATGCSLQTHHRFLTPPIVNGHPTVDSDENPRTADGMVHPWSAMRERILCTHCLG